MTLYSYCERWRLGLRSDINPFTMYRCIVANGVNLHDLHIGEESYLEHMT